LGERTCRTRQFFEIIKSFEIAKEQLRKALTNLLGCRSVEIFRDPVAYAIGLVAVLAAIAMALHTQPRRGISYEVLSVTQLLTAHEEMEGRLLIRFDGAAVRDISIVLFQIFNSGNQPIVEQDFDRPLRVVIRGRGRILSSQVTEKVPEQLVAEVATVENDAVLTPRLMNAGDMVTVKLIITEFEGSVVMSGRIVGVSEFANAELQGYRADFARLLWLMSGVVGGLFGLMVFLLLAVVLGQQINQWPDVAQFGLLIVPIAAGVFGGLAVADRVVRGPRVRSREYVRTLKERQAQKRAR
jgi:hypothetical protein